MRRREGEREEKNPTGSRWRENEKERETREPMCLEPSAGVVCENRFTNARDAFYTRRRDGSSEDVWTRGM